MWMWTQRPWYQPGQAEVIFAMLLEPVRTPPRRNVPLSGSSWPLSPTKPEYSPSASACQTSTRDLSSLMSERNAVPS